MGKKNKTPAKINFFRMVRDVFIASMSKGQFPLAITGIILMLMIIKMPSEDVSKLVFKLIDLTVNMKIIGYVISFFTTIGWYFHSKFQRRTFTDEINRISEERNELQKQLLGKRIKSSR